MGKMIIAIGCSLLLISCEDNPSRNDRFSIQILDDADRPVAGAIIDGGFDWDYFRETTDINGFAAIPDYGYEVRATIHKNNFFSRIVNDLIPGKYKISRTPDQLVEIGEIEGKAIRFIGNRVITVGYNGAYRLYEFNDNGVRVLATDSLQAIVKGFLLFGDTLWYTSHEDGIFIYSLANPESPQFLHKLEIGGYLGPFARQDSLVAVGDMYNAGPIRIFAWDGNSGIRLLGSIGNFLVRDMIFISNYLITLGTEAPGVFDVSDPANPVLVYSGQYGVTYNSFFHADSAVLTPDLGDGVLGTYEYNMIDFAVPSTPVPAYRFTVRGHIEDVLQDSLAVGKYYFDDLGMTIFRRVRYNSFDVAAIISENYYIQHGGGNPPYFIIGSRLYKLEHL